MVMMRAGLVDGFVEADPLVAAIVIGAVVVAAIAFVVMRVRKRNG